MNLKKLNAFSFDQKILEHGESCLVAFTSKDCHACKQVITLLAEMSQRNNPGFHFYLVNAEENKDLYKKFAVRGLPAILFFKGGIFKGKLTGKLREEQINKKIFELLHSGNTKIG